MSIPTLQLNDYNAQFLDKYSICLLSLDYQNVDDDTVEQVAFLLGAVNPQVITNDSGKNYLVADYFSAIQPEIEKIYHTKDFSAEATYQGIKTYSLYISTDIFPNDLLAGMSDEGCYIEYSEAKTVNYNNYVECLEHIKGHFNFSQLGDTEKIRALTFNFPGCWWLTYMFYRPEDSWVGNGYQIEEFRKMAQNPSSLELASNIKVLYSCPEYTEWLTLNAIWQNNQWLLSYTDDEKLRQSLKYAAVLGGKTNEPKPREYDAVLGSKK